MDLDFLAIDDLGQPAGEIQEYAESRQVTHLLLVQDERPLAVLPVAEIEPGAAGNIAGLIDQGEQLQPAPEGISLGRGLTDGDLYVGENFAVYVASHRSVVLLPESPEEDLLEALGSDSYVMADPRLPGPPRPLPPDQVLLRCPIGPHTVLVDRGTQTCPDHPGEPLSQ